MRSRSPGRVSVVWISNSTWLQGWDGDGDGDGGYIIDRLIGWIKHSEVGSRDN